MGFLKELFCLFHYSSNFQISKLFLNVLCISIALYEVNQRPEKEKLGPYQAIY